MEKDNEAKQAHLEQLQEPLLHGNGSGYKNLSGQLEEAYRAIQTACEKLRHCTPHGRDYYPLEAGALQKARKEHFARGAKLSEVLDELAAMQHALYEQKNPR